MIPHAWALPWRKRIRLYLGGVSAIERYETARRAIVLRRWIERKERLSMTGTARDGVNDLEPVVVIVRDPDYSNEVTLHGIDATVYDIDLGSQFTHTPETHDQAVEWATGWFHTVSELPPDHPARRQVERIVFETFSDSGVVDPDRFVEDVAEADPAMRLFYERLLELHRKARPTLYEDVAP